jgi:23S rRNA pseudouridine1911/1915/1917 synthase
MGFRVLYEDDVLLVVDKDPGLVVDRSDTQKAPTLVDLLESKYQINVERAGIVHRIDKDTSGILLVAKTAEALENLQNQFKSRTVKKQYIALVHGSLKDKVTVDLPIARSPFNREKFTVFDSDDPDAKAAITEFLPDQYLRMSDETLNSIFEDYNKIQLRKLYTLHYPEFTLVRALPLTGRTHQIRVHLKHLRFPIVSDERYVGRKTSRLDRRWVPRQFLHAAYISFDHPVTGKRMEIESPLPEDLEKALENLESRI